MYNLKWRIHHHIVCYRILIGIILYSVVRNTVIVKDHCNCTVPYNKSYSILTIVFKYCLCFTTILISVIKYTDLGLALRVLPKNRVLFMKDKERKWALTDPFTFNIYSVSLWQDPGLQHKVPSVLTPN